MKLMDAQQIEMLRMELLDAEVKESKFGERDCFLFNGSLAAFIASLNALYSHLLLPNNGLGINRVNGIHRLVNSLMGMGTLHASHAL